MQRAFWEVLRVGMVYTEESCVSCFLDFGKRGQSLIFGCLSFMMGLFLGYGIQRRQHLWSLRLLL